MAAPVRINFLGGVGEIGRNCAAIENNGEILVVDCGLMFPNSQMPGVDLVLPDFTYLRENKDKIVAIVITHGHEDHAGALAYLLRDIQTKIYGSATTLALAQSRIEEAGLLDQAEFHVVNDRDVVEIGNFKVEFIPMTHSVPNGFALAIHTSQGLLFHTGDFKIDLSPIDGRSSDVPRIRALAENPGIRLLFSDSTNAEEQGHTKSESEVGKYLLELFSKRAGRRIIVACFASHIHRIQQIIWASEANGRRVATLGRSMARNVALAQEMKLLTVKPGTLIAIEDIDDYEPGELCVLSTGSQGEPLSALALLSENENKWLAVDDNDVIIMSSHVIPGNESNVYSVIDGLYRHGAEVIYSEVAPVHSTGHAKRDELEEMIRTTHPDFFIPVHGEYRHLVQHRLLAIENGLQPNTAIVAEDGDVFELSDHDLKQVDTVPAGYVYVDGLTDDLTHGVLRDRQVLSEEGVVIVVVTIDRQTGKLAARPEVITRGWIYAQEADELLEEARQVVRAKLEASLHAHPDVDVVRQDMRRALGKFVNERTRRRPMIVPIVMEA
jgi:ribonuclease J